MPETVTVKGTDKNGNEIDVAIPEAGLVNEEPNIIWVGETGFEADGDKLVVLVDEFRSGFECARCLAKDIRLVGQNTQVSFVKCEECAGKGKRPKVGNKEILVNCSECNSSGAIPCPDCGGKGGTIATPKNTEGAPTTGRIVSIGPLIPEGKRKLGDRVMFASYAGNEYGLKAKKKTGEEKEITLRILRDEEVICKMHGVLKLKDQKSARALYTNA
jgi:co-chaperonin GroES (HSP10)